MQFVCDQKTISFSEVSKLYPHESSVLKNCQNLDLKFEINAGVWSLVQEPYRPIKIEIQKALRSHKETFFKRSPYSELIAKAIGLKAGREKPSILDATGGLMGDSLLMLSLGLPSISVYERHPLAACLIINALNLVDVEIDFEFKNSSEIDQIFDVIYFDPMYSEASSKNTPKKEMVLFRQWIGPDNDALRTAMILKQHASSRLVIKRSLKSHPLIESPSLQFKGKSTRYDVYLSL